VFLLVLPAIALAVLIAYYPAWHGGLLWDDDGHLTRPALRSLHGLWRIWLEIGATQQYYPLVHSMFWLIDHFWGTDPLAYHLLNIVLHSCSAFLVVLILRRLSVPGALLAGVLFALHPIQVESVAWMTELKNALSGVLYFSAALCYLEFDRTRKTRLYGLALALFVLALLSKTVAATLPFGLLVIFWWQRGSIDWRRDVVPLVPFAAAGLLAGLTTAWVERSYIGAQGREFDLSAIDRLLVAGRAVVFYGSKLVWPANLIFLYPRWNVSASVWWQYLFPVAVVAALVVLWRWKGRTRAPFAALAYFVVTLGPALGFVNVYPFKYSFVADHFQYLAGVGIMALGAAVIVRLGERIGRPARVVEPAAIVVLGLALGVLTWNQSRQYADAETLYRTTLARNPRSWLAHNNLAMIERQRSGAGSEKAWQHFQAALEIDPDEPLVHYNIGTTLMEMGRLEEALAQHREAVRLAPGYAEAHGNIGVDLQKLGRYDEAVQAYRIALSIKPELGMFRTNLGVSLEKLGRNDEASAEFREALTIDPQNTQDHHALGDALMHTGHTEEAIVQYREATRLDQTSATARNDLGYALFRAGRLDEAEAALRAALLIQPGDTAALDNLGNVLQQMGRLPEAIIEYEKALKTGTGADLADVHNDLGVALARLGRSHEAIAEFREAIRLRPNFEAAQANLQRAATPPK
jgi:tetratricopeptide (TPR) repeat protein